MAAKPQDIVYDQMDRLRELYEPRVNALKTAGLPPQEYTTRLASLQTEYDERKARITQMADQLDEIRKGMEAGTVDRKLGDEAMWRMVLPPEHAAAMFPRTVRGPAERAPLSPGVLKSHGELIEQIAKAAPEEPGWEWGPPKRTQENLIVQYDAWKDRIGYENYTTSQQRQLDLKWDGLMKAHKEYKWDPSDPQIKARRTYGSRMMQTVAKKVIGEQVSPFGQAIKEQAPKKKLDAATARALLAEAGGDKNKARELARQRGYKF